MLLEVTKLNVVYQGLLHPFSSLIFFTNLQSEKRYVCYLSSICFFKLLFFNTLKSFILLQKKFYGPEQRWMSLSGG